MLKRETVFLSLGSNLNDRLLFLENAKKNLCKLKIEIEKESSIYETEPLEFHEQPFFLNQVLKIKTSLEPLKLLFFIKNIEQKMGRIQRQKNGPREIDIDILFYNVMIINLPELIIPHPAICKRRFVLVPMVEIEPDFVHPVAGKTVKELLLELNDNYKVKLYKRF